MSLFFLYDPDHGKKRGPRLLWSTAMGITSGKGANYAAFMSRARPEESQGRALQVPRMRNRGRDILQRDEGEVLQLRRDSASGETALVHRLVLLGPTVSGGGTVEAVEGEHLIRAARSGAQRHKGKSWPNTRSYRL